MIPKSIIIDFLALLTISVIASCNTEVDKDSDINNEPELEVNIDNATETIINLSELANDCKIIHLDNKEEALLNSPMSFAVSDDLILVIDVDQYPVKLFNNKGKFMGDIGTIGSGPGEYLSVVSPYLKTGDNTIWLLVGGNYSSPKDGWYVVYDTSGELLKQVNVLNRKKLESNYNDLLIHGESIYIPGNADSEYIMIIKSIETGNEQEFKNTITAKYFTYTANNSTIYPYADILKFKIGEADTIYSYNPETGEIKPEARIYTEKHRFDEQKIKEARSSGGPNRWENIQNAIKGCYSIILLGESKKYYIMKAMINGPVAKTKLLIIEKNKRRSSFAAIKEDILSGMILNKIPYIYNNRYLIFHYSAIEYRGLIMDNKESIDDGQFVEFLESELVKTNKDDNDVLIIAPINKELK